MDNLSKKGLDIINKVKHKNKLIVPIGNVKGVLLTAFGAVGTIAFSIPIVVMVILGFALGNKAIFHSIAIGLFPLLLISIISLITGNKIRKRLKKFQSYIKRLNNRKYCQIKELSLGTGQSNKAVVKDLKNMIELGMFPEGFISEDHTYFMLNQEVYREYLKLQEGAKIKKTEEKIIKAKKANDKLNPEERKIIEDGRESIKEIKRANHIILGEELSNKLYKIENVGERIFNYVEDHPHKLPQIKKFTDYFLPTTLKLIDTYIKLDDQPIEGQNILTTKKEIEETMDTIYQAFENLLDGLFEDVALDISTDISVLETILTQEGLMKNNINLTK